MKASTRPDVLINNPLRIFPDSAPQISGQAPNCKLNSCR